MTYRELLVAIERAENLRKHEDSLRFQIAAYGGPSTLWSEHDQAKMAAALAKATADLDSDVPGIGLALE